MLSKIKKNNKGFTLMEMLIVVAIIAVLVAIAIPTFNNALEKSREATDEANIRAAYAEVMACALTETEQNNVEQKQNTDGTYTYTATVGAVQKKTGWEGNKTSVKIAGQDVTVNALNGWTITFTDGDANATISETTGG